MAALTYANSGQLVTTESPRQEARG
uniref:Uncharacterized protein n=1 Tax=Anguilla anguilla TaxID=7936 RepID=A0A0E9QA67_ANGAN